MNPEMSLTIFLAGWIICIVALLMLRKKGIIGMVMGVAGICLVGYSLYDRHKVYDDIEARTITLNTTVTEVSRSQNSDDTSFSLKDTPYVLSGNSYRFPKLLLLKPGDVVKVKFVRPKEEYVEGKSELVEFQNLTRELEDYHSVKSAPAEAPAPN